MNTRLKGSIQHVHIAPFKPVNDEAYYALLADTADVAAIAGTTWPSAIAIPEALQIALTILWLARPLP